MNKKQMKKKAMKAFKKNYWRCVAVAFLVSILGGFYLIFPHSFTSHDTNFNIMGELFESITHISISTYHPTRGILANLFNNITASGNFIFGILNSLNQLFFHEHIKAGIIILLGAILTFLYWFFIRQVLIVGENRFFLENKNHFKTPWNRIFLPYKIHHLKEISCTMARKTIYEWLWWLTIIGGIWKHYAYALVPYIIAENPGITGKKAIQLSQEMMKGKKWQLFLLDCSFLLWYILDLLTFHLLSIVFVRPYRKCCLIEFYFAVKKEAKSKQISNCELLCDDALLLKKAIYDDKDFMYPVTKSKINLKAKDQTNYSITSYILLFFIAAIIGWLWEVGFHLFRYGSLVNRGVLHGPWLPIYGYGMISLLILLKKFRNKPFLTFILAMLICGVIEYSTSVYLEYSKGYSWWDYDGYFLNINGRVCLEGVIAFGLGGCAFIYFFAPAIETFLEKINKNVKIILCVILISGFIIDSIYTTDHPNSGEGITKTIEVAIKKDIDFL